MSTQKPLQRQLTLFAIPEPLPLVSEPPRSTEPTEGERRLALRRKVGELLDTPVTSLVLTRNRTRMLSAKPEAIGVSIRLHRVFLDAPEAVIQAVARLCDRDVRGPIRKQALAVARDYFAEHASDHARPLERLVVRTKGRVYDLVQLRDRVEAEYFGGDLKVHITWGQGGSGNADLRRGGIHIRLGSYDAAHRLVRIHPVLDREDVPEYVVESVVHHEMLHAAEPPVKGRVRRRVHTRAFRRRERQYRHYEKAERWIESNLKRMARWRQSL